jgi:hypothetical protein
MYLTCVVVVFEKKIQKQRKPEDVCERKNKKKKGSRERKNKKTVERDFFDLTTNTSHIIEYF